MQARQVKINSARRSMLFLWRTSLNPDLKRPLDAKEVYSKRHTVKTKG